MHPLKNSSSLHPLVSCTTHFIGLPPSRAISYWQRTILSFPDDCSTLTIHTILKE